jgi:hypothetical protein
VSPVRCWRRLLARTGLTSRARGLRRPASSLLPVGRVQKRCNPAWPVVIILALTPQTALPLSHRRKTGPSCPSNRTSLHQLCPLQNTNTLALKHHRSTQRLRPASSWACLSARLREASPPPPLHSVRCPSSREDRPLADPPEHTTTSASPQRLQTAFPTRLQPLRTSLTTRFLPVASAMPLRTENPILKVELDSMHDIDTSSGENLYSLWSSKCPTMLPLDVFRFGRSRPGTARSPHAQNPASRAQRKPWFAAL